MSDFDEPIHKKLGYLQITGREPVKMLALMSTPTPEQAQEALDKWRKSSEVAALWAEMDKLWDHHPDNGGTPDNWGTPDEAVIASVGEVLVTGIDYADWEARLLAHGITITETRDGYVMDLESYGMVPGLNRQLETYASAFKHVAKIAEPELPLDERSWEKFRDRRHGRRKQRRSKK